MKEGTLNLFKNIVLVILLLAVAYLMFLVFKPKKNVDTRVIDTIQPTNKYIDNNGVTHSEIASNLVSKEVFEQVTDSYKNILKGRNSLQAVIKYVPKTDTIFRDLPLQLDTNRNTFTLSKRDNYIDAEAKGNLITKKGDIKIRMIDTITSLVVLHKHFFKANEQIINLSNRSPYSNIVAGSSITVKQPKDIIVVTAGGYYDPINNRAGIAIGAGIKLFSIYRNK